MDSVVREVVTPPDGFHDPAIEGQLVEVLSEPDDIGCVEVYILTGAYKGHSILMHFEYLRPFIRLVY